MKKPIFLCILIFMALSVVSQTECQDIIYTSDGNKLLFSCCIKEVINGNIVIYTKDGEQASIEAYAINKEGHYIELDTNYNTVTGRSKPGMNRTAKNTGYSYAYYERQFNGARATEGFGVVMSLVGLGMGIGGYVKMVNSTNWFDNKVNDGVGLFMVGGILFNIGMPLFISGAISKANNHKAMERINQQNELSFGFSNYGFGLVYHF